MKRLIAFLAVLVAAAPAGSRAADATAGAAAAAPPRVARKSNPTNDFFYRLGPDSKPMDGVPHGKFVGPKIIPSNVFPGTQHTYWVYVPAQYDPARPTAVMIFNDGHAMMAEPGEVQAQYVLDNLIYRREIPVMLGVFINPGRRPDQPEPTPRDWGDHNSNRPEEYNPPTDRYARVVVDELMPALKSEYNISPDPDLHGIMGASSGGCAAFSVAWFRPNDFRKVITVVGSFTDIRGEYIYPELVAQTELKPIRIFMQDGRNDNRRPDNLKWDWFYQNVRLMKALTNKGYEVNYSWGIGNHGQRQGGAIFPDMMRWLWRDQPVSTDPNDTVERSFRAAAPASEAVAKPGT
ncbi:MAG TPA: alpha/beta hydrolase-fold protein [Candidatus Baltobacteraceae bacterium]|jgi:enterochelin esterase family protein|nr:alpha/beta hydrolase-fold protein [Candidatus Baltobacteraceae bacterium]